MEALNFDAETRARLLALRERVRGKLTYTAIFTRKG